jgi:hypothetical protein
MHFFLDISHFLSYISKKWEGTGENGKFADRKLHSKVR